MSGSGRVWANLFIVVCLGLQITAALAFYTRDSADERFSWRMFSTLRLQRCEFQIVEVIHTSAGAIAERILSQAEIQGELHVAWVKLLERQRPQVIDKYLRHRCRRGESRQVQYIARCPTGAPEPRTETTALVDCRTGAEQAP